MGHRANRAVTTGHRAGGVYEAAEKQNGTRAGAQVPLGRTQGPVGQTASSSSRLRVLVESSGMPGPIVVAIVAVRM